MNLTALKERLLAAESLAALKEIWEQVEKARQDQMSAATYRKCKRAYSASYLRLVKP